MMKLQSASKKEIARISLGTAAWDLVLVAGLFLLSQFGIGTFTFSRILWGVLGGSAIAIGNFTFLCLTIQKAADTADQKQQKAKIQLSYNFRMLLQGAWCVVALLVPGIHIVAAAAPLLFPTLTIYFLQWTGRLTTPSTRKNPPQEEEPDEERLESFEA